MKKTKDYIEVDLNTNEEKPVEAVKKDMSASEVNKAFSDTKKVVEEAKPESLAKQFEKLSKRNKLLSRVIIVMGVLLIACCIGLIITINKLGKDAPKEKIIYRDGEPLTVIDDEKHTAKAIENLDEVIKGAAVNDATVEVVDIAGFQHLKVTVSMPNSGRKVDILYRNEFATEKKDDDYAIVDDGIDSAYIECGQKKIPLARDISADIASLIPMVVNIAGEEKGLLFYNLDQSINAPINMTLYNIATMEDMGSINFKETLYYYLTCRQYDEANADGKNVVTIGADSSELYNYCINADSYKQLVESGEYVLQFFDRPDMDFNADGISFKSYVSVGKDQYVGEYTMIIDYQDNGINLSKVNFDAYVGFDYEDPGGDRLITPRDTIIEEGMRIWGDMGGHYIVPLYKNLERDNYTPDGNYEIEKNETRWTYTNPENNKKTSIGIDVSAFQENINWDKVVDDGIEFAIIRIGYRGYSKGAIVEDEYFENNLEAALAKGLKVGVYIFSQAINEKEAIEEAEFIIDKVKKYNFSGPIVFDTEQYENPKDARANLISRAERTAATKAFCETVEKAGYLPVVYANTKWMLFGIDMDELYMYPTWFAYYGNSPSMPYHFDIWQYSCEGKVDGINGNVDMNMMFENVFGKSAEEHTGG